MAKVVPWEIKFMCEYNSGMDENVLPPWPDWQMIWISREFAKLLRRISLAMELFR